VHKVHSLLNTVEVGQLFQQFKCGARARAHTHIHTPLRSDNLCLLFHSLARGALYA